MRRKFDTLGIVSDAEIERAFGSSFSSATNKRVLLEQGVLKVISGVYNSYTLTQIMIELKLITAKLRSTKHGRRFIYHAFYDIKLAV